MNGTTKKTVEEVEISETEAAIRVLLANGRTDDKMRLGIANQDYPRIRGIAESHVMTTTIYCVQARRTLGQILGLLAEPRKAGIYNQAENALKDQLEKILTPWKAPKTEEKAS